MRLPKQLSLTLILALAVSLCLQAPAFAQSSGKDAAKKSEKSEKKEKKDRSGTPVLWRDHTDVAALDLLNGPGGAEMQPDISSLTFIRDETGGYSKKYRVRDAKGRVWVAKVGKEAQAETAATRLVWAAGYVTEITYLAPRATIQGKGDFENVRFEARPDEWDRLDLWKWTQNPFAGTREMQGLKVMMAFIENWDLKDDNNKVLWVPSASGNELRYVVSDLGATFGKTGGQSSPMAFFRNIKGSRNEPGDYAGDKFVEGVEGGSVKLHFSGKMSSLMRGISVADAKWVGQLLARLSDKQIEDAFRAANYTAEEVGLLTQAVRTRINELTSLP
jgi:hypothetical protein